MAVKVTKNVPIDTGAYDMRHTTDNSLVANSHPIAVWHRLIDTNDSGGLFELLAEDVVFHSPLLGPPQHGRTRVAGFLLAAFDLLSKYNFCYVREIVGPSDALLDRERKSLVSEHSRYLVCRTTASYAPSRKARQFQHDPQAQGF